MERKWELLQIFPLRFRSIFERIVEREEELREIRIRANAPLLVFLGGEEFFLDETGILHRDCGRARIFFQQEIDDILRHLCDNSIYAFEEEIKQGFLTIRGGHRIGITGQAVLDQNGKVHTIKHISCLNIRVAHEVKGVADCVMKQVYCNGRVSNTMIISPPGCGKTTMLRDMVRQISNGTVYGNPCQTAIVDERCEIAGCYRGIAQNDVGLRTDILDSCPKGVGMMMLLRSMAPQVMAIDELGGVEDVNALLTVVRSGCSILATIHGENLAQIKEKRFLNDIFEEKLFRRFIVLSRSFGKYQTKIMDEDGRLC